jgi:hypothetical protein
LLEQENEILRRLRLICPRRSCREIVFSLVREMSAATGARIRVPVAVAVACRAWGSSTKGGTTSDSRALVSQRDWDDAHLINAALESHAEDSGDAYRFIADELAELGFIASEIVWGACARCRRCSRSTPKKRGLNRKPGPGAHDVLLAIVNHHGRPG